MKVVATARLGPGSMVKRSRVQSQDVPSFLCCSMMMWRYLFIHSHMRRRRASLPHLSRDMRRGHNDTEALAGRTILGSKVASLLPEDVQPVFHLSGVVGFCHLPPR